MQLIQTRNALFCLFFTTLAAAGTAVSASGETRYCLWIDETKNLVLLQPTVSGDKNECTGAYDTERMSSA